MKRIVSLRLIALIFVLCAIAASLWIAVGALHTRRKAERLLAAVQMIKVGDSNMDRIYQLAHQYDGRILNGDTCMVSTCKVEIIITNKPLARFYLAPWTGFSASFFVRQGRTIHVGLELASQPRNATSFFKLLVYGTRTDFFCIASVQDDSKDSEYYPTEDGYKVVVARDVENRPEKVIVHLTPGVTEVTRDKALAFNLGCLSKLGGCRDASELLPAVWHEYNTAAGPM